jgi:signal transduction histidine kinase
MAIVVTLLFVSILAGLFVLGLIGLTPPGPAFAIAAVFSTLLSLLLTVVLITIQTRSRIAVELEQATEQLHRLLVRQRQAQWFAERSLGRALHGPIQNSVLAAASRLEAALTEGDDPAELLRQLRNDLMDQVAGLGVVVSGQASFDTAVARLQATWQGVCSIAVHGPASPSQTWSDDPITLACLQDIVIEFVSNSVRHGGATSVNIDLWQEVSPFGPEIHVRARSNAGLPPGTSRDGLGTRMHDEWATSWSLAATCDAVELTVVLPV